MILYFFYTLILLLSYFFIGFIFINLFRIKIPVTNFVFLFSWFGALGFIISSIIIALIFSYGKTIALASIIPLAWFIYSLKIQNIVKVKIEKINVKEIFGLCFIVVVVYILNYYHALNKNYNVADTLYRADVSNLMFFLNKETSSFYNLLKGYNSTYTNYHYMYLWNNAIVSHIFTNKNPLTSYVFIFNPTLLLICVLLFYSILRTFINNIHIALFLAISVWFFPCINYSSQFIHNILSFLNINISKWDAIFLEFGFQLNNPISYNLYQLKTINFLLIFLFGINTYLFNNKASISVFGIAPIFSPLLLTFPSSYYLCQLLNYKYNKKKFILLLIPTFILIYFIITFFILASSHEKSLLSSFFLYPFMCEFNIKTLINYILAIIFTLFVFGIFIWLPIFLYSIFIAKNQKSLFINKLILLMISMIIFAILCLILTYGNISSCQYIEINLMFLPFISFIVLSYFISVIIKKYSISKKYLLILTGLIFILISYNIYNFIIKYEITNTQPKKEELFNTKQCLKIFKNNDKNNSIKIGIINGLSYINNAGESKLFNLITSSLYIKETYFTEYPYRYRIVSVLLDTLPCNTTMSYDKCFNKFYNDNIIKILPFDIYFRNMTHNISVDSAVLKFIKMQNIQYVLLTNRPNTPIKPLPVYLRNSIKNFYVPDKMKQDTLFEITIQNIYAKNN